VTAQYSGDSTYGGSVSTPVSVTVGKENSQTSATLVAYDYTTGTFYQTNSIPYGTIFFLRSSVANSNGGSCAPNPGGTQVGCPARTVNFSMNDKPLGAGSYALTSGERPADNYDDGSPSDLGQSPRRDELPWLHRSRPGISAGSHSRSPEEKGAPNPDPTRQRCLHWQLWWRKQQLASGCGNASRDVYGGCDGYQLGNYANRHVPSHRAMTFHTGLAASKAGFPWGASELKRSYRLAFS